MVKTVFELKAPVLPVQGSDAVFPVNRVFCVGRNYADHAKEMGADPTREAPFFFSKPACAVFVPAGEVPYPTRTADLHHEAELVVALHKGGRDMNLDQAREAVYGMPYDTWKAAHVGEATPEQLARMKESVAKNAPGH